MFSQRVNRATEEKVGRRVKRESKEQWLEIYDLPVGNTGYQCLDMLLYLDKDVDSFVEKEWSKQIS